MLAAYLNAALNVDGQKVADISLIESPDVPRRRDIQAVRKIRQLASRQQRQRYPLDGYGKFRCRTRSHRATCTLAHTMLRKKRVSMSLTANSTIILGN